MPKIVQILHFLWLPWLPWLPILYFFIFFSLDIEWSWVANHFGVLHDRLYALFDAWYHKHTQKYPKIVQNWSFYDSFMVAMVTELIFFIIFILNLIGLAKPVILVYHMTCFKLLLVWRSPKTVQKQWKWQK